MKPVHSGRRDFLWTMGGTAGTAWLTAQWPSITAAAQHAQQVMNSKQATSFEVLTAEQATEVVAIAARIFPTDEQPGATEAGVVYFIDRALKTFASDDLPAYQTGLKYVSQVTGEIFPGVTKFSAATPEQQDKVLTELSKDQRSAGRGMRRVPTGKAGDFFPVIWGHTLMGFLADPEMGGNRDYVGWKVIGRDPAHSFSPPFGEYDKNYPGWQAAVGAETGKK
jgi:gluconate 2-dehydrogenase gamma chain